MLLLVHANMALSTNVAFYHKVGTISDGAVVFKYFMASIDPHFYFVVYVVPYRDTIDIFYIPKIDNMDSFSVVPLFDSSYGEARGLSYGETVTIALGNEKISGMAEVVEVEISIPSKPIVINDVPDMPLDSVFARQLARDAADILEGAHLYTLANQLMIIVESKIKSLVDSSAGVDIQAAAYSIIQQLLTNKYTVHSSLSEEMTMDQKNIMYRLVNTIINLSPYNTDIVRIFSDIALYSRSLSFSDVSIENIPYNVFYRLSYNILSTGSTDSTFDVYTAANAIEKSVSISMNMSTMEESAKVYELLGITQSFVYLTNISFKNLESGEVREASFENIDPDLLVKKNEDCVESRTIQSQGNQVTLQYGYGTGCDLFAGMIFKDSIGSYGIKREDKLLDGDTETSRMWIWGENSIEMFGNEIDSSNNIEVTFTGV